MKYLADFIAIINRFGEMIIKNGVPVYMTTRMKYCLVISLCCLCCFSSRFVAAQGLRSRFEIGTWFDARLTMNDPLADSLMIDSVKRAGFTFLGGHNLTPSEDINGFRYALQRVKQVGGIRLLVKDQRFRENASDAQLSAAVTRDYKALQGEFRNEFMGFHLADEPGDQQLPMINKWVQSMTNSFPSLVAYVGLFPTYVGYDTARYKRYVDAMASSRAQVVAYDYYPFNQYGMRNDYFWNMKVMASAAGRYNKVFWPTVYATQHYFMTDDCKEKKWTYVPVTAALLQIVTYAPLCYGANGIMYFTYASPGKDGCGEEYEAAARENPELYSIMREHNAHLSKFGNELNSAKWMTAVHGNKTSIYSGETVPTVTSSTPVIKSLDESQLLVGIFASAKNVNLLTVLNKDSSATIDAKMAVSGIRKVERYNASLQSWEAFSSVSVDNNKKQMLISLSVSPADLQLFRLSPVR